MPRRSYGETAYYAELGALVASWNQAENSLREMLVALCGARAEIWILTAELGSVSLQSALRSAATDIAAPALSPYIEHCVLWFDTLREYRNYYIHGINDVGPHTEQGFVGVSSHTSAKTRLVIHQEFITKMKLARLRRDITAFLSFSSEVLSHVVEPSLTASSGGTPFPPLPEMPPLPDRLQKPRQYLTNDPLPPASSQAKSKTRNWEK
jgi:hypothetical protein